MQRAIIIQCNTVHAQPEPCMCTYFYQDLEVLAEFPKHMADLRNVLSQVDEFQKVRQRLSAEMADNSGVIRNLVVRAEDARMMNDMWGVWGGLSVC